MRTSSIWLVAMIWTSTAVLSASPEPCALKNGDVNGDGQIDLSDAVYTLSWLFLGGAAPVECPAPAKRGLPATGQTICYDSAGAIIDCASETCSGQDAFYAAGCPLGGRFADNGDGTISDTCTGLMWLKATADLDGDGVVTPFDPDGGPDQAAWHEALEYCESLQLAGYEDWRLPNARELHSLIDYGRDAPNPSTYEIFDAQAATYWTSTSLDGDIACVVDCWSCSHLYCEKKEARRFVRAVRSRCAARSADVNGDGRIDMSDAVTIIGSLFLGTPRRLIPRCAIPPGSGLPDTGQKVCYDGAGNAISCESPAASGQDGRLATGCPPEGRFADHGDGTVTDACTGLMWLKATADVDCDGEVTPHSEEADSPDEVTWAEALRYCEDLRFGGFDDWRLPNVQELEGIVDYGRVDPCIDPVFGTELRRHYWTSTTLVRVASGREGEGREDAWAVNFWYGSYTYHQPKAERHFVRPVRTAPR